MPKIAVYTIALNEEQHVRRWYESAKDADLLLIADTGSKDKTVTLARFLGVKVYNVEVKPWRFDIARNASLALVPEDIDICIQLDMDETLSEGWREKVEKAWQEGNTWPIYKHVTSRYPDGTARNYQHYFKIHPRKGFIWKYPIHEVVIAQDGVEFKRELIDLEVDHIQDHSKNRQSYLSLLETAVQESPDDWRMNHYLNREYWYMGDSNKVILTAEKGLRIPGGWDIERASTCMWASDSAMKLGHNEWALEWAERATQEAPTFYEAWHWHAHICHLLGDWKKCFDSASKILTLDRQNHHLVKPEVWEWWGYDLFALSAHKLGDNKRAVEYGRRAIIANPNEARLKRNLEFYIEYLNKSDVILKPNFSANENEYPIPEFPQGGTEILLSQLKKYSRFDESKINLIMSIADPNKIDKSRKNILWQHLNADQENAQGMSNLDFLMSLDAIVFVSHWQYHQFRNRFTLPDEKCYVIKNAIEPVKYIEKSPSEKIQLVYTSTPWRGLDVLLDSFELLNRDDCQLNVYSSTAVYGKWFYESNDKDWEHLYSKAREIKNVVYRGYVPHEILQQELSQADLLAYPSTWAETFCLSAVEAGAAGARLVTTDLGALPEILGDKASLVPYSNNRELLVKRFSETLEFEIQKIQGNNSMFSRLFQHQHFVERFSWIERSKEWQDLFLKLTN